MKVVKEQVVVCTTNFNIYNLTVDEYNTIIKCLDVVSNPFYDHEKNLFRSAGILLTQLQANLETKDDSK